MRKCMDHPQLTDLSLEVYSPCHHIPDISCAHYHTVTVRSNIEKFITLVRLVVSVTIPVFV